MIGTGVRDPCGKSAPKGNHAGARRRGGFPTARGKRVHGVEINAHCTSPNDCRTKGVYLKLQNKVDWSERYETPVGKARLRETPQAHTAEEAFRPPAESEYMEWKSTFFVQVPIYCRQKGFT
ncbi:hypothetical protein CQ056_12450 [Peribacillus simplex]|nr:hypothetical protein CQ056_12450 [Peribacillus simplex]